MLTESSEKQDYGGKISYNEAKQTEKSKFNFCLIVITEKLTAMETY